MLKLLKILGGTAAGFLLGFGAGMFLYLGITVAPEEIKTIEEPNDRLMRVESIQTNGYYLHTWVDTRTGVQYWQLGQTGLCPVLDADGQPILYEEE